MAEVATRLGTDPDRGLTAEEAAGRLRRWGPNELEPQARVPAWRKLLRQFADPVVYLLLGAVVVSLVAWVVEGRIGLPFEALVIAIILVANAVLGFAQEARAEAAVAALQRMAAPTSTVLRDGAAAEVPANELVPGDVLILAEGEAVSADGRLVEAASLQVAEAALTGESEPVLKESIALSEPVGVADRVNMVFNGTSVTRGRGRAVVTATGMATEMGRVAQLLAETEEERSPLQREVARVGRILGQSVIVIALIVVGAILLTADIRGAGDVVDVLLVGVSLAVAAVPEGLPAILSVVLALGVQRMAKHRAIIKNLSSVETLGSASVICSDKTGTLTQNQMTVRRVVTASGEAELTGTGYTPEGEVAVDGRPLQDEHLLDELRLVLAGGSLANDAAITSQDGAWAVRGDPTDVAFLVAERKVPDLSTVRSRRFHRIAEVPFSSERKLMSSIEADAERDGRLTVVTKGAPDVLLARCTRERVAGQERPLTEERRRQIHAVVERLADQALRPLAVAYRPLNVTKAPAEPEALEQDLIYAGVVGMIDPPRPEVRDAIAETRRAKMRVVMITGDHPRTAARIATELGIVADDQPAMTGTELAGLDDDGLRRASRDRSVYARVAPEHKLRLVDAIQANGNIVAVTGDGVNDAPALKTADIGIAMGRTGTDVTKEAANMILADDNFATIVRAVREGRGIFANIRSFLRYLLSSNIGEVLTMFLGVVLAGVIGLDQGEGIAVPLLATHILWINLLTDTGPALAIGVDPPPGDIMRRPPRRLTDRVIDAEMWRMVGFVGLIMAVVTLLTFDIQLPGGLIEGSADPTEARAAAFTTLVLAQLFNCFNARSERTSAFRNLFTNPLLWVAVTVSLLLQVAVIHLPLLNEAFETTPLTTGQWALCAGMASFVLWAEELRKLALRRRRSHP
ncbi:cation-translocating P-type ATPase [Micromonospora sp. U56]|uniref:cation-translocating P-type ATPase n=1 Tax=Micromonospora sp. U56 TaxID=2824900 RepID=UPI001B37A64A|nr:cation-translocating P-type ATPase [Micromonospora sp. U56]MBQ0895514.1 cation-translocating P-type ATPase [Micromonospora sp. U56]